ncbi:hypothetical protein JW960_22420 [candidate division KSB1 bacterium]|nr:hypothetical protein [candidate division KSB1 bacterium]
MTQKEICTKYQSHFNEPNPADHINILCDAERTSPIKLVRLNPENRSSGWYVHCGGKSSSNYSDFDPVSYLDVQREFPEIVPFLALMPGFIIEIDTNGNDDGYWSQYLLES